MPDYAINTQFNARDRLSQAFNKMGNKSRDFGNRANRAFNKASSSGSRFGDILKGILGAQLLRRGFQLLKEGLGNFIVQAQLIEDATAQFTPLMGSVQKATELVEALNITAANTPFQFEGISKVASQLLPVMNASIEDTISTFNMLGDTAGGNMQKLESITRGYTKALLKGKPDMESLNMIAEAGVPIFTEMAKSMGITVDQLFDLSKQGKLTSDDLTKTFQDMTSEGGIFFEGMIIASKTLTGRLSTLKDNVNLAFGAIGTAALPILKDFVNQGIEVAQSIREWVTANQELIKSGIENFVNTLKMIFTTLEPPIAAVFQAIGNFAGVIIDIATSIIPGFIKENATLENGLDGLAMVFNIVAGFIDAFASGIKFLKPILVPLLSLFVAWTAIQWALNVAMAANPLGLIVVGIALVIAGIGFLIDNWDLVVKVFQAGIDAIIKFFQDLWYNILWPIVKFIGDVFTAIFTTASNIILGAWELISGYYLFLWNDILVPFGTFIKDIFTGNWEGAADAVISAWNKVGAVFQWLWDNILSPIFDAIGEGIKVVDEFLSGIGPGSGLLKMIEEREAAEEDQTVPNETAPNKQEAEAKTFSFLGRLDIFGAPDGSTVSQDEKSTPGIDLNLLGVNP